MESVTQTNEHQHHITGERGPVYAITPTQEGELALGHAIQLQDGQWVYGETDHAGEDCLYREALAADYGGNVYARRAAPQSTAGLLGDVEDANGVALRRQYDGFVGFFRVVS